MRTHPSFVAARPHSVGRARRRCRRGVPSDDLPPYRTDDIWCLPGHPDAWLRGGLHHDKRACLADVGGTLGEPGWETIIRTLGAHEPDYMVVDLTSLVRLSRQDRLDPAVARTAATRLWDEGAVDLLGDAVGWELAFLRGAMRGLWPRGRSGRRGRARPAGASGGSRRARRGDACGTCTRCPADAVPHGWPTHERVRRSVRPRRRVAGGRRLGLETATALTPAGLVERPVFFTGFPARPEVFAAGLLAVADVAATTYADFGQAQRLANLDPVVTASGDRMRFESFSGCNSVHARLDLLPDGIDEGDVGFGTTNVDINQPLRTALARMRRHRPAPPHGRAGRGARQHPGRAARRAEGRRCRTGGCAGLAEVPYVSAAMTARARLTGGAIGRLRP